MKAAEVLARYRQEELPEFEGIDLQSVSTRGLFGSQPLHIACVRKSMEEVTALVLGGADVNARGEHGNTPLHESGRFFWRGGSALPSWAWSKFPGSQRL